MNPDTYEFSLKYCMIRPDKADLSKARVETPWTVDIGVFKDYLKEEKPKLINDCFEYDWKNMKQLKYKKSEEKDVMEEMRKVYPLIKDTYRNQAGYGPSGNVFSIGMNQLSMFTGEVLNCIDQDESGKLKNSDADRLFITVNATGKRQTTNPANAMIRCQLMEFIIRASIEKFYASEQVETELDAVKKFNEEYVIPKCKAFNQTKWRFSNTFNVYVDNVMKVYKPFFDRCY